MVATIEKMGFSRELAVGGDYFARLAEVAEQLSVLDTVGSSGPIYILGVPAFRHSIEIGKLSLHRPLEEEEKTGIIQALNLFSLAERLIFESLEVGGASLVHGFIRAAQIIAECPEALVFIVGGEALSEDSGLRPSRLISSAGLSVAPPGVYGTTLDHAEPLSLIDDYALEGSHLPDEVYSSGAPVTGENPFMSGRIRRSQIAGSKDGAFIAVVRGSDGQNNLPKILTGASSSLSPIIHWWQRPMGINVAYHPISMMIRHLKSAGIPLLEEDSLLPGVDLRYYGCFPDDLSKEAASVLEIKKIGSGKIRRIQKFIQKTHLATPLSVWGGWGISSALSLVEGYISLREGNSKILVQIGNGGVSDIVEVVHISTENIPPHLLKGGRFTNSPPVRSLQLITDPQSLSMRRGRIMKHTHRPPYRDHGGVTYVGVELEDDPESMVITNLTDRKGDHIGIPTRLNMGEPVWLRKVLKTNRISAIRLPQ